MEISELSFSDDRASQVLTSPIGSIKLEATNIRRERTGIHARVCIYEGKPPDDHITFDNFNLDRDPERTRLFNKAWKKCSTVMQAAFPQADFERAFDLFNARVFQEWETARFTVETYTGDEPLEPVRYTLAPYIQESGGTIVFAPPGSGKSALCQLQAICIANGITASLWDSVIQTPVLYVNLERPSSIILRRDKLLCAGLRLKKSCVAYLNARGFGMDAVARKVQEYRSAEGNGKIVVFWDSISRTGLGSLVEDTTANSFTDRANAASPTWVGVGHTARASDEHLYGSIHFDAGEDIGVLLKSESETNRLGMALTIQKANEGRHGKDTTAWYALDFTETAWTLRRSKASEFPALSAEGELSLATAVRLYISDHGASSAVEIAEQTGLNRSNVSYFLNNSQDYTRSTEKRGREVLFEFNIAP